MEYMAIMKDPYLQPLGKRGFGNEASSLFQGIHDIPEPKKCFFVELKTFERTYTSHLATLSVTTSLTKRKITRETHNGWRHVGLLR
jgi:hypothetical protein